MLLPMMQRPRPSSSRTPRALRPRSSRRWGGLAIVLGALGAALWVGWLLPADTGAPLGSLAVTPVEVPAVRPVPRAATPTPSPRTGPVLPPEVERAPEVEGPTAENRQWFRVEIVDADGEPSQGGVMPVVCDGFDYDRETGLHSAFAPGACVIEAVRRDGALMRRSAQATLHLVADGPPQSVRLEIPEERTGGIGVRFLPMSTGMRVVSVVEGGPAWEAGLEVGDVIVTVDGEAVDGLDQQEFVRRMTGPEGSSVEFEVMYRDGESDGSANEPVVERVRVNRRYLDG